MRGPASDGAPGGGTGAAMGPRLRFADLPPAGIGRSVQPLGTFQSLLWTTKSRCLALDTATYWFDRLQ